jgi:L,D-peptidoglycan transpeptidase YkuD (ErfK/YbiS/YcfS/YnhG family)
VTAAMNKISKTVAFAAGVVTLVAAGVVLALQAQAEVPPYFPTRLTNISDSRQVIVVVGRSRPSSYSTVYTYQKGSDGIWRTKFAAMAGRNGRAGWVLGSQRVQNTGTSPMGTYRISTSFGLKTNPGTKIPYRQVDGNDYWVGDMYDAKTYNLFEPYASTKRSWRISQAERLAAYPTQYEYTAVIDFNRPAASSVTWNSTYSEYVTGKPVNTTRGSAIFLHIIGAGATAGCVSLGRTNLINVLRWLDPVQKPRIVMAPLADIGLV